MSEPRESSGPRSEKDRRQQAIEQALARTGTIHGAMRETGYSYQQVQEAKAKLDAINLEDAFSRKNAPRSPQMHGTHASYVAHRAVGETPCDDCRTAQRAYDVAIRAKRKTWTEPTSNEKCGTNAGASRHYTLNERPCDACRAARRTHSHAYRRNTPREVSQWMA